MRSSSWWADEMLGRLARYLRFVGLDTEYRTGLPPDEICRRVRAEGRTLVTRNRTLARRSEGSILLTTVRIDEQWREMIRAVPSLPRAPAFVRCALCNGALEPGRGPPGGGATVDPPIASTATWVCAKCGHLYWEGSHTAAIRQSLSEWAAGPVP